MSLPGSLHSPKEYISLVVDAILSCSLYREVLEASTDNASIKPLVKRLTDQRKMSLLILTAILAYNVHDGRVGATQLVVALILFTLNISSMYDGVSDKTCKTYITALGPISFTFINSLPRLIARAILWIEVFRGFESKAVAAGVALLISLPWWLQTTGNLVAMCRHRNRAGADDIPVAVSV